jgi:phage/plasmid-associated DNA primase
MNWIADLIQNPGVKPTGAALLLFSEEEGSGKNTYTALLERLVGGLKYYYETPDPANDLYGLYNEQRPGKLVIVVNEADAATSYANVDKIKSILTEPRFTVREKFKPSRVAEDYARYVFTSNNKNSMKLSNGNRRVAVFEVSNKMVGDHDYFNDLYGNILANDSHMADIFAYFKNYTITMNIVADKPITEMAKMMCRLNIAPIKKFLVEYIMKEIGGEYRTPEVLNCKRTELFAKYKEWGERNGLEKITSKSFDADMFMITDPSSNGKVQGIDRPKPKNNAVYYDITVDDNLMETIEGWV